MFETDGNNPWDEADQMAVLAYDLYETGQMSLALGRLNDAIEINPGISAWHFNAGLTLDALERFEEAIAAYKKALELSGDDVEILNSLAVDYTRTGRYDLSISVFERIQQMESDFEPCYCNRIITYAEMDRHDKAEQMFYLAQQIDPDCPICFYNIGNSLFVRQQYEKAIWCWNRTALLDPGHPEINYRIAQAHWANGNYDPAGPYFLEQLRKNPGDTDIILDFGIFLAEAGEIEGAKEKFNRVLELTPDSAAAKFYLGEIALNQNDYQQANALFEEALERDRSFLGPRYRLAQLAIAAGDGESAFQFLLDEYNLEIDDVDVLLSMASMFLQLGKIDHSTEIALRVADEDPANVTVFEMLGVSLLVQSEFEGALQFFEHAISLGSNDSQTLAYAAQLYFKTGQLTLARKRIAATAMEEAGSKDIKRLSRQIDRAILKRNIHRRLSKLPLYKFTLLLAQYKYRLKRLFG